MGLSLMENSKSFKTTGLKVITIAAIALLLFTAFSVMLNDNEGISHALLTVDEENEFKVVQKGHSVTHEITIENTGGNDVFVELFAEITSVTLPGTPGNWSVRFMSGNTEIENISIPQEGSGQHIATIGVEVSAPLNAILFETATTTITARDAYVPIAGTYTITDWNTSFAEQGGVTTNSLTVETMRGQEYQPEIEIAPGTDFRKKVNPNNPTTFLVKVSNLGLEMDSIRLRFNVGSPIRGETRATTSWKVVFAPSAIVQDLMSEDYSLVYVNVTAPSDAIHGEFPITITATSQSGYTEDSMLIRALIPIPDLYIKEEDIIFSRFPVIDGQQMKINVTINNDGGALEDSFVVWFWIEDTNKENAYTFIDEVIVGQIDSYEVAYAEVTFNPELANKVKDTLTTVNVRIVVDANSEVIETDEDNNQAEGKLEIMQSGKAKSSFTASVWMIMAMVALCSVIATYNMKYRKKNE
jgi:hypothetical protein